MLWDRYCLRIVALRFCPFKCHQKGVDNHDCPGRAGISKISSLSQILERESQGIDGFSTWACSLCLPVTEKNRDVLGAGIFGIRAWQDHAYPEIWEFQRQGNDSRTIQGHLPREAGTARRGFLPGITISGIPDRHSSRCEGWEINSGMSSSRHRPYRNPKPTKSTKTSPKTGTKPGDPGSASSPGRSCTTLRNTEEEVWGS